MVSIGRSWEEPAGGLGWGVGTVDLATLRALGARRQRGALQIIAEIDNLGLVVPFASLIFVMPLRPGLWSFDEVANVHLVPTTGQMISCNSKSRTTARIARMFSVGEPCLLAPGTRFARDFSVTCEAQTPQEFCWGAPSVPGPFGRKWAQAAAPHRWRYELTDGTRELTFDGFRGHSILSRGSHFPERRELIRPSDT